MSMNISTWEIKNGGPNKLTVSYGGSKHDMEGWIVNNPGFLQADLVIIGRQIYLDSNAALDLVALDIQGRLVIINIKQGMLDLEDIARLLRYTNHLSSMTEPEVLSRIKPGDFKPGLDLHELLKERDALDTLDPKKRNLSIILAGTKRSPDFSQAADFLAKNYNFLFTSITFQTVKSGDGKHFILSEHENFKPTVVANKSTPTINELQTTAEQNGVGFMFDLIIETTQKIGLCPQLFQTKVIYGNQANEANFLFAVWIYPFKKKLKVYLIASEIAEHYNLPLGYVENIFGITGWLYLDKSETVAFAEKLKCLAKMSFGDKVR